MSKAKGNMRFYRADPQGSIVALTNRDGELQDTFTYDAYGNPDDPGGQPIRYTGRRFDAETGLYYYRNRYYSPALGRFISADPIGYLDNTNLYTYVGNDPINHNDPTGMICTEISGGPEGQKIIKCETVQEAAGEIVSDPKSADSFTDALDSGVSDAKRRTNAANVDNSFNLMQDQQGVDQGNFITEETEVNNSALGVSTSTKFEISKTNSNPPDSMNPDAGLFSGDDPFKTPDNLVATAVSLGKERVSSLAGSLENHEISRVTGQKNDRGSEFNPSLPTTANITGAPVVVATKTQGFVVIFPKRK